MQATAAHITKRELKPLAMAMLAAWFSAGAVASAQAEASSDFRKAPARPSRVSAGPAAPASSASAVRCANYGEGFVPVVGSESCVKIGGRLRIDLGASGRAPVYSGSPDGINPAAHLRLGR